MNLYLRKIEKKKKKKPIKSKSPPHTHTHTFLSLGDHFPSGESGWERGTRNRIQNRLEAELRSMRWMARYRFGAPEGKCRPLPIFHLDPDVGTDAPSVHARLEDGTGTPKAASGTLSQW